MARILIAEDSPDYRELLYHFLESAGYAVTEAKDGAQALEAVRQNRFDLI